MVELIPVIELAPSDFATKDRASPRQSLKEAPGAWEAYWLTSLADAGIEGLVAIEPGSWLVALDQFSDSEHLGRVLAIEISDVELDDLDTAGPLGGGYVLTVGERLLEPGCCGDLTNLEEWLEAVDETGAEWSQLWIGHPWTHVRAQGGGLELAVPSEDSAPVSFEPPLVVDRAALRQAIRLAEKGRQAFLGEVRSALEALVPTGIVEPLATILVEGHPPMTSADDHGASGGEIGDGDL